MMINQSINEKSYWLWPSKAGDSPNQYVQFRHEFVLPESVENAQICISCDTNYALWINGEFVDCGQYHDFPDYKTCDVINLLNLKQGKNVIAFHIYYQGTNSFQYIKGSPGLIYQLKAGDSVISSGSDTLYRIDKNYKSGEIDLITYQIGYTFEYNSKESDDWRSVGYTTDTTWNHVSDADMAPAQTRPIKRIRPIKKLIFGERLQPRIAAQGVFVRKSGDDASPADLIQTDYLSARNSSEVFDTLAGGSICLKHEVAQEADGIYLVLDFDREEVGFLDLDLEAALGTVIDIAWGEHLDDLRVRASIEAGKFACKYVCKDGRQRFTHHFTRIAGRYLQLHISNMSSDITINYAGLIPVEYPIEHKNIFTCSDSLHNKIYDTCVRTMLLCMHEHYEDCPWREQALWAMDMRNEALAGYYSFGEYDFPAASIDLFAMGLRSDGYLGLCAPIEIPRTIPVFSLAWVLAAADHYQHSGDKDALKRWYPCIKTILDKRAESIKDGLLPTIKNDIYWNFYDWADGLSGGDESEIPNAVRYDAPMNLFYILALDSAVKFAEAFGDNETKDKYQSLAKSLRSEVHNRFWDASEGSYLTFTGIGTVAHYCELTQSLAILAEVCGDDIAGMLREKLAAEDNKLVKTTLCYCFYKFEAMLTDTDTYRERVFEMIKTDWGYMLFKGATSFWETLQGSPDFHYSGSLCHGWSGIPAYFYHKYYKQK